MSENPFRKKIERQRRITLIRAGGDEILAEIENLLDESPDSGEWNDEIIRAFIFCIRKLKVAQKED